MKAPGLVSVIVPVFNRPRAVAEAIDSVLGQTYKQVEILVVDDGSTDETPETLDRYRRARADVRVLRIENSGPGLAREKGRLAAKGEFLQYLDSDDLLRPRKLELQVEAIERAPRADVAYGMCVETMPDGSERRPAARPSDENLGSMFPTFLGQRWWNTVVPLYRREIVDRAGAWTDLRLEEDWEYDARIAALRPRLAFVPEVLAEHRDLGGARLSRDGVHDAQRLRDRARAHLSILRSGLSAGVPEEAPERQRFARELFMLCRQCGEAGLREESRQLFEAARRASTPERARGADFRAYRMLAAALGWRGAAVVARWGRGAFGR